MMRISLTGFLFLCSSLLMADAGDKRFTPLGAQSLLETGGGLLLILMIIIGGAWLVKRYGHFPVTDKHLINVLGGVSVGPRERVVVLKIEGARLVVGVAPGQVRTLHVLSAEAPADNSFKSQLAAVKSEEEGT